MPPAVAVARLGLSFWLAMPFAGLVAALVAVVIGYPILRLKGVYFAMVTLMLTETARLAPNRSRRLPAVPRGF